MYLRMFPMLFKHELGVQIGAESSINSNAHTTDIVRTRRSGTCGLARPSSIHSED